VLIGKFNNSQLFSPVWPDLGLKRAELDPNREKTRVSSEGSSIT